MLRAKIILQVLAEHSDRIKMPDLVMGYKLSRTKPAQIAKWLKAFEKTVAQLAPALEQRIAPSADLFRCAVF